MRRIIVAATALISTLVLAGVVFGAGSAGTKLTAKLNNAQEVPKPSASGGSGKFTGTLMGRSLTWKLTFTHLSGPATAAHIHLAKRGKAGPVAVPLCGPCRSGVHGKTTVPAKVARALKTGGAYVNVHTAKNANGEIRGQIKKSS
jgi:CHRD domain